MPAGDPRPRGGSAAVLGSNYGQGAKAVTCNSPMYHASKDVSDNVVADGVTFGW